VHASLVARWNKHDLSIFVRIILNYFDARWTIDTMGTIFRCAHLANSVVKRSGPLTAASMALYIMNRQVTADLTRTSLNDFAKFMVAYLSLLLICAYVIQSTKLHLIAWLSWGSVFWIWTVHLPPGMLSSDELNDVVLHVCTSGESVYRYRYRYRGILKYRYRYRHRY